MPADPIPRATAPARSRSVAPRARRRGSLSEVTVVVRPARAGEAAELAQLGGELGYDLETSQVARRLQELSDECVALVAECDGRVAGWIEVALESALVIQQPSAIVTGLVVTRGARRRGVGRALVDAAVAWAREHGARALRVRSRVQREDAHAFYEALGFERVKTQVVFRRAL